MNFAAMAKAQEAVRKAIADLAPNEARLVLSSSLPGEQLADKSLTGRRPTATRAILDAAADWSHWAPLVRAGVAAGANENSARTTVYTLVAQGRLERRGTWGSYEYRRTK